jgi:rubrerythrin
MSLNKVELLEMAIYKEIAAHDFYQGISQKIADKGGKKKFLDLADEEMKHRQLLSEWLKKETGRSFAPDPGAAKPPFRFPEEAVISQHTALEAISIGIQLERDSANFYASWKEQETDLEIRTMLQGLVEFEQGHYLRLKEEFKAVSQNFYWI